MRAVLLVLPLLVTSAEAQSFNLDFGSNPVHAPLPAATYGGALGQLGTWNAITAISLTPAPLVDLAGAPTPASISIDATLAYLYDTTLHPTSVHRPLLNDWFETNGGILATISGLSNGWYAVVTYSGLIDLSCARTLISVDGSNDGMQSSGVGPSVPDLFPGNPYTLHHVAVTTGQITVRAQATPGTCLSNNWGAINGIQITHLDGGARAFCAGDGSAAACPCANAGSAGRGCANAFEPNGAAIQASGTASTSADSAVLTATGVSNAFATFFQGTQTSQGGMGVPYGDGLLCAGGSLIRLGTRLAVANQVSYPAVGDSPISLVGGVPAPGSSRVYQLMYRDSTPGFCTTATFNTTNAVALSWSP